MKKAGCSFLVALMLFLGACSATPMADQATLEPVSSPQETTIAPTIPETEEPTQVPAVQSLDAEQLRNSKYQLGLLDQIQNVQLRDGRYQEGTPGSEDYISVSVTDFIAWGDLNGDEVNEAVSIVTENYGGSEIYVFLAVYQTQDDELSFLTSIYLDDRPLVNVLSIQDGEIFVDAVIHDFNDAMCCPTLPTRRYYSLNGFNLTLTDYSTLTPTGQPRVITIEAPVDGVEVSGIVRLKGNITIAPFENNLVYRIYDLGGLELSVGPVTVEAPDLGAPGTFEKAIDLGNILEKTSVRIAVQDINAEDGSLFAMDSVVLHVR
jgi:hypothetical protein